MDLIKPKAIGKGSHIGIVAPANFMDDDELIKSANVLHKMGFKITVHPQCHKRHHCRAGTAAERAAAIHDFFEDSSIDAILCARGGSGHMRTEAQLDYTLIRQNPKIFMALSDGTYLLHSIQQKAGLVTFHGPVAKFFIEEDGITLAHFAEVVAGNTVSLDFPQAEIIQRGTAKGPLTGGNLTTLTTLLGTPMAPQTEGAILFIEDINEPYYVIDRLLWHLKNAGKLENIQGLIIGEFSNAAETNTVYGITPHQSILELFSGKNIPIVANAPCGHGRRNATLPLGVEATLNVRRKGASLTLAESAVNMVTPAA